MRHAPSTLHFSHAFRPLAANGAIEWEELPSLAARIATPASQERSSSPWDSTRPAPFDAGSAPMPFREPVRGLAIREVHEPDVFRHFFGR